MWIGIVPFVYDEAKRFYISKKAVKDSVKDSNLEKIQENKKIIKVKRTTTAINNFKDMTLIDIEKLWKDTIIIEKK